MTTANLLWRAWAALYAVANVALALEPIAILSPDDVPAGYGNGFGASVAISGDYLVIGAPLDPWYDGSATGAAYVFRRQGRRWIEQGKLIASDPAGAAYLGSSVDIDGDMIVAGAPRLGFMPQECGSDLEGAAYVFRRDDQGTPDDHTDDTWPQEAKLTVAPPLSNERLGMSVAISGDVIVVAGQCRHTAEVFRRNPGPPATWSHEASLLGSDVGERFPLWFPVDVDGDRIVIGTAFGYAERPDAAYVFVHDNTTWVEQVTLVPTDDPIPASFGSAVALSGDHLAVTAPSFALTYVFTHIDSGVWKQQAKLTMAIGTEFGSSASIDGDLVLASKEGEPWALLFRRQGGAWTPADSLFGVDAFVPAAVAIHGKFAAVWRYVYAVRDQHDLRHFSRFQACFTGKEADGLNLTCARHDVTADGFIDLTDYEKFVGTFVGP